MARGSLAGLPSVVREAIDLGAVPLALTPVTCGQFS